MHPRVNNNSKTKRQNQGGAEHVSLLHEIRYRGLSEKSQAATTHCEKHVNTTVQKEHFFFLFLSRLACLYFIAA